MDKILLFASLLKDKKLEKTYEIAENLTEMGYKVYIMTSDENYTDFNFELRKDIQILNKREEIEQEAIELVVVIGGDGSLIGYCRKFRDIDVPVVGLNIGTLGFLPELSMQNYERTFRDLRDGRIEYTIQERTGLYVEWEDGEDERLFAINEITISRGIQARIIEVEIYINGIYLDAFTADGMIVATPTGSTAYSLSAGGPILLPSSSNVVITPICPHSLSGRPIVVTKDDIITLKLTSEFRSDNDRAVMTIDGQEIYQLKPDSIINIKNRNKKTKVLIFDEEVFYRKLREKIK